MESNGFIAQAFIYLLATVAAVPLAKRLGLGSVLGYLLAGVIIGPFCAAENQADAIENKADAIRKDGENKADAIEKNAKDESKAMKKDGDNAADATRKATENAADNLEKKADAVRDAGTPLPAPAAPR